MSHSNIQEREKERWRGSFALIRNDCYANSFQRELTTEVGGEIVYLLGGIAFHSQWMKENASLQNIS